MKDYEIEMMQEICEVQDRLHREQMEMEKITALIKFSDLILSSPCHSLSSHFVASSALLNTLLTHKDALLAATSSVSQTVSPNSIMMPRRLQETMI